MPRYGLVVVGAGIAGLYAALSAADDTDVLVLCRGELASSNSFQAQGGVAAALGEDDDPACMPPTRCAPAVGSAVSGRSAS